MTKALTLLLFLTLSHASLAAGIDPLKTEVMTRFLAEHADDCGTLTDTLDMAQENVGSGRIRDALTGTEYYLYSISCNASYNTLAAFYRADLDQRPGSLVKMNFVQAVLGDNPAVPGQDLSVVGYVSKSWLSNGDWDPSGNEITTLHWTRQVRDAYWQATYVLRDGEFVMIELLSDPFETGSEVDDMPQVIFSSR